MAPAAYAKIVAELRSRITSGDLQPGVKIPSERQLCEQYAVSAITVRRAVQELRNSGLVVSQQGRGVFVREHRPLVRIAPWRYWRNRADAAWIQEAETAGRRVSVEHTTVQITASQQLAERLGIDTADGVVQTSYLVRMDGTPVSTSRSWEPAALTVGTSIEDPHSGPKANTGVVPRFDSIGHYVTDVHEDVEGRMPTSEEVQRLEVAPGVPLMLIKQTFYAGDLPVEAADIMIPADRYTLSYRMRVE